MLKLRSHLASLLLLCFLRVLLPDALILALHEHRHTEKEAAHSSRRDQALLSVKHQHCAVDHFFDVPFQPALPLEFTLSLEPYSPAQPDMATSVWLSAARSTADQRGPPGRA